MRNNCMLVVLLYQVGSSFAAMQQQQQQDTCTDEQQRFILPTLLDCETRDEVVRLELPNETYAHLVPNHVVVKRCGGSSNNRYHSCLPTSMSTRSVPVLLFPVPSAAGGAIASVCANALVQEHKGCESACRTLPEDCNSRGGGVQQRFLPGECRCACTNAADRAGCIAAGRYWNPALCQCLCRDPVTFPDCPTGYRFDAETACSCVDAHSVYASAMLEVLLLILASTGLMAGYGVVQCYRNRVGLFREEEGGRREAAAATELRAIFRQDVTYEPIDSSSPPGSTRTSKKEFDQTITIAGGHSVGN